MFYLGWIIVPVFVERWFIGRINCTRSSFQAEEAVNASRKSDALSPYTQFIIFKLALMRDDDELGK